MILGAVAVGFLVKGVAGMGGPLLAIPLIATVTSVEHAVVVVSFANLLANAWLVWEHRRSARGLRWLLLPLLLAGTAGTIFGSWLLTELDDRILSWVLAGIIAAYILRFLTRPQFRIDESVGRRLAAPVGLAGGVLTGGTGSGGPLYATYLHALRLDRSVFIFSISTTFLILGPIQMGVLASLGSYTAIRIEQALLAVLPLLVVFPLGVAVSRRMPQKVFEYAVLALLALSAVRLVM
ncbi:MAG: sulfite exporter TauE/SafE family protein [Actinomycetota bacterium]